VWLELYDEPHAAEPTARVALDPDYHRIGDIWCIHVAGIGRGQLYGFRAEGPYAPEAGHRFNAHKLLLDPFARAVTGVFDWALADARGFTPGAPDVVASMSRVDSAGGCPKCIVIDDGFDWEDDHPLRIPMRKTVIYEVHVRGFTVHPSSRVSQPGTFIGLAEKIPYLQALGVTAVELLPVQEFDEREHPKVHPETGQVLGNYWGYSTVSFFAPESRYSATGALGQQVTEFKSMVKALHRAGIEVILDVVYNHTSEGDETGPTLCFRGLDNRIYYLLDEDRRRYLNFSGCGNTLNCNHPLVRDFILECLRYWKVEMHVDGFRFDLASVLGRDQRGRIMANPPLLEWIAEDPVLRDCKLIAEAWDAAGAYQVGQFPHPWAEWNGVYRDDVRRFWRGDPGQVASLATRLAGSSDLYQGSGRSPLHSINFVTCHDGFTLADLVTYEQKRNLANAEDNRDGTDDNLSWNCGVEGSTDDPSVIALRERQVRNFLATLLLSQGVPMLLGGDEHGRTQRGNNNAYNQDNEISWFDWDRAERQAPLTRFVAALIRGRRAVPSLRRDRFFTGAPVASGRPDITWFGPAGGAPDWHGPGSCLAAYLEGTAPLYLMFNGGREPATFMLPELPRRPWRLALDTADGYDEGTATLTDPRPLAGQSRRTLIPHSLVILIG
jgi:glycogen operon protein